MIGPVQAAAIMIGPVQAAEIMIGPVQATIMIGQVQAAAIMIGPVQATIMKWLQHYLKRTQQTMCVWEEATIQNVNLVFILMERK